MKVFLRGSQRRQVLAKGIYGRKGLNGDVTYYIRYQADGTDIKERVGRKSRGFTREVPKEALRSRLGDVARGHFNLEKVRKPVPFSKLAERYREFASGYKRGWYDEKCTNPSFGQAREHEREPDSRKSGFPLSRERRWGDVSDERCSHAEKSPG